MKQFSKGKMTAYSLLMIVLVLTSALIAGEMRNRETEWYFGEWNPSALDAAHAAYQADDSNENLATLLKGLCWQYKLQGDESVKPQLLSLGQQLLDRAKSETADLEQMDGDGVMTQVLRVIREVGAR